MARVGTRLPVLCRDCFALTEAPAGRRACASCGGLRLVRHLELARLTIAHIDCDAFFASVEKRDRPELSARPVIVGGSRRGVVVAACYVARLSGVRSAMPMFQALALCPDAVVLPPDFSKYAAAARTIRARMLTLTPLMQPLSIDEAVLDLSAAAAGGDCPAALLARFAHSVEVELGLTVSIGLAPNRLLAKLAAGRDKPRGFAVIGTAEARAVLAPLPVRALPGIGPALERHLASRGIRHLGDLQALGPVAARTLGRDGPSLVRRATGEDFRPVVPNQQTRSVSVETTLAADLADPVALEQVLAKLGIRLAERLQRKNLAAEGVVLKLKTRDFATRTRHLRLPAPTGQADPLLKAARTLLAREADGLTEFRLIGLGAEPLADARAADRADLAAAAGVPAHQPALSFIDERLIHAALGASRSRP